MKRKILALATALALALSLSVCVSAAGQQGRQLDQAQRRLHRRHAGDPADRRSPAG